MKVKLKKRKKSPAPSATEQAKVISTIEMLRKTRAYGVPIRVIYDRGYQQIADIEGRGHRATKNSETPNAFMTSEQKKQVADALVSFVLSVTNDSHCIEQEEATTLPAILDFLAKTDSPKTINFIVDGKTIRSDNL